MSIRSDASSLIFFAYWDRRRLPAGRQGRTNPIINFATIVFLSLLPAVKVFINGTPLPNEVNFIRLEGITDNQKIEIVIIHLVVRSPLYFRF